jgi:hypothetical protein
MHLTNAPYLLFLNPSFMFSVDCTLSLYELYVWYRSYIKIEIPIYPF